MTLYFFNYYTRRFCRDNVALKEMNPGYFIVFLNHVLFTFKRHLIITLLREVILLFIIREKLRTATDLVIINDFLGWR